MVTTTIADIAQLAGIAKSTVSRYLNGSLIHHDHESAFELTISYQMDIEKLRF